MQVFLVRRQIGGYLEYFRMSWQVMVLFDFIIYVCQVGCMLLETAFIHVLHYDANVNLVA